MKKTSKLLLSIIALLLLIPNSLRIKAEQPIYSTETIQGGLRIIGVTNADSLDTDIVIPDEIDGQPVLEIGSKAFFQTKLTSVVLGKNITAIQDYAFAGNQLTSLTINDKLNFIGENAFRDNQLTSINLKNVLSLQDNAFSNNKLTTLTVGEITSIGNFVFSNNLLTKVSLPDSIKTYGSGVFSSNNRYVLVTTTNPLIKTEVIDQAFGQVVNPVIVTVHFIDAETKQPILNDEKIGTDYTQLDGIVLLNQPNTYQTKTISGYQALDSEITYTPDKTQYEITVEYKNLKIKPTIEVVGSTYIPSDGDGSKAHLLSLVKATDLDGNDISDQITVNPESIDTSIPGQVKVIYSVTDAHKNTQTKEVTLSVGTNWYDFPIGKGWVLKDFTYDGNKVTGFSETGLEKVKTQKELVLPHLNPADGTTVIDTVGINDDDLTAFRSRELTSVTDYNGSIKVLEGAGSNGEVGYRSKGAFKGNSITSVILPNVESIESYAFMNNQLTDIRFPKATYIGPHAFQGNQITAIDAEDLPLVQEVGYLSFTGNALTKVHMPSALKVGGVSFYNNDISDINFPKLEHVGNGAFLDNQIPSVTPDNFPSLSIIEDRAFNTNKITTIDIPSVTELRGRAFASNTEAVLLDNLINLKVLGNQALRELGITELTIPKLESVGSYAFYGNPGSTQWGDKVVIWSDNDSIPNKENYVINPVLGDQNSDWNEADFTWDTKNPNMVTGFTNLGMEKLVAKENHLVLPDRAQIVGASAFENVGLVSVQGNQVHTVLDSGFYGNKLTDINQSFPNLKIIDDSWAFGSNQLTNINLPLVTKVGNQAFISNPITSVTLTSVETIGIKAFATAPLTTLVAPEVVEIGTSAFYNHKLTELNLPKVKSIGATAFAKPTSSSASAESNGYPDDKINGYQPRTLEKINLPLVETIGDIAFAGNKITEVILPQAKTIARRAFDQNLITTLQLNNIETIAARSFASNKLNEAYLNDVVTTVATDAFNSNRNLNTSKKETMIFLNDGLNPNNIQDGYVNNIRQYIVNPTKVTVKFLDQDGNEMAQSISEYILAEKTYQAVNIFNYNVDQQTKVAPDKREPVEIIFRYTKQELPKNTAGIELRQFNEMNNNTGQQLTRYHIGELMTTKVYLDLTGIETNYPSGKIKLFYDPKYIDDGSIQLPTSTSVTGFRTSHGVLEIDLNNIDGGYQVEIPIKWRFNRYVTPDNYTMDINALFEVDGNILSTAAPIQLQGYYNQPDLLKASPLNLPDYNYGGTSSSDNGPRLMGELVRYVTPDNSYEYKVGTPYPVEFNFNITALERNVNHATITDTLPTYIAVKPDGTTEERVAIFDPALNPNWSLSSDQKTVSQSISFPKTHTPGIYFQPLKLLFPDLKAGYNVVNHAQVELIPDDKLLTEKNMMVSDDISIYTGFYENVLYEGDPRMEKFDAGIPHKDTITNTTYFYDIDVERQAVIPYLLRISSLAQQSDLVDVILTDYKLDERLYYYGISFPRDSHTAGHIPVDVIAYQQVGSQMNPEKDTILASQSLQAASANRVTFNPEIAKEIDYVQIVLPKTHKMMSALEVHVETKLRDPLTPIYDTSALSNKNIFVNHAVLSANLYQKGTTNSAHDRHDPIKDNSGVNISQYTTEWDHLEGNYLWGVKDEVEVRDYNIQVSIDKLQSYPNTTQRVVYPGESGTYTLTMVNRAVSSKGTIGVVTDQIAEVLENFEMIDLMPQGVLPTNIQLSDGFRRSGGSYELITNYRNTGRLAIVFKAPAVPSNLSSIASINTIAEPDTPEGTVTNEVFMTFDNDRVTKIGTTKNPPNYQGTKTYLYDQTSFRLEKIKEMFARKYIKKSDSLNWLPTGIQTESQESFEYKLSLINSLEVDRSQVSLVDFFPYVGDVSIQEENIGNKVRPARLSQFENSFDLSRKVIVQDGNGIVQNGYKVYYWNSDTPIDYQGQSADAVIAKLTWSTTPATNTRAIKVVADEGVVLKANSRLDVIVPMKAPKNTIENDYNLAAKRAWNTFVRKDNATIRYLEPNKVYNELPYPKGSIKFTKFGQNELNAADVDRFGLANAEFEIYNSKNEYVATAISDKEGQVIFNNLPIQDTYTIKEVTAPKGYRLAKGQVQVTYADFKAAYDNTLDEFKVVITDDVSKKQFLNVKPVYGKLLVDKVNKKQEKLPYIKFNLVGLDEWNKDINVDLYTSSEGSFVKESLIEGRYRLTELLEEGKTAYKPIAPIEFVIDKDHPIIDFTEEKAIVNEHVKIMINKVAISATDSIPENIVDFTNFGLKKLDGYQFIISEVENPTQRFETSPTVKGVVSLDQLDIDTLYQIEEIKKEGTVYAFNPQKYQFKINSKAELVDADDTVFRQNALNFPNPEKPVLGKVSVEKLDNQGKPLEGALFGLYQNDQLITSTTSKLVNGKAMAIFTDLESGSYTLKEIEAPVGYTKSMVEYTFTVPYQVVSNMVGAKNYEVTDQAIIRNFAYSFNNTPFDIQVIKGDTLIKNVSLEMAENYQRENPALQYEMIGFDLYHVYLPLKDVKFELFEVESDQQKTSLGTYLSDTTGKVDFKGYRFNSNKNYELIEVSTNAGYQLDTMPISLNLNDETKLDDFNGLIKRYKNNRPIKGRIIVSKYDEDQQVILPEATFALYKSDDLSTPLFEKKTDSSGLLEFRNLELGTYTLKEIAAPENYQITFQPVTVEITQENTSFSYVVNNPRFVEFDIDKKWLGNTLDEVLVSVYADDQIAVDKDGNRLENLSLNKDNGYHQAITNLPKYTPELTEIVYTVKEQELENYQSVITGNKHTGFVITNQSTETIDLKGQKHWDDHNNQDGKRPQSITVRLYKNGTEIDHQVVSAETDWKYQFNQLPKYEDLKEVSYVVTEDAVANYNSSQSGNDFTNIYTPEKTSINVIKRWDDQNNQDGKRPESVIVNLLADGVDTQQSLTLSKENHWSGSFTDLPMYQNGQKIEYSVQEVETKSYTSTVSGDAIKGFTITNQYTPEETEITIHKVWNDFDNQDKQRPSSVIVELLANHQKTGHSLILSSENNWSGTISQLPVYQDGQKINYTIVEVEVKSYKAVITGNMSDGFTITNHYQPQETTIKVSKKWDDLDNEAKKRPVDIVIQLIIDGQVSDKSLKLSNENNWRGEFTSLPVYQAGKKVEYSIKEVEVNPYTSIISGNADEGFVVTNIYRPEKPNTPPEVPEKPNTPPEVPEKPNTPPEIPEKPKLPNTGDQTPSSLWIMLLIIGGCYLVMKGSQRKKD